MPQRFGDFATWTGSIGTVAAFGTAFYQIRKERGHRIRREIEDRLRAQREHADRVSAWLVGDELVLSNTSGHPIRDVEAGYLSVTAATALGAASPSPDATADADAHAPDAVIVLDHVLPGETRVPAPHAHASQVPTLEFTDIRGDRWRREPGARFPHLIGKGPAATDGRR